MEHRMDLSFAGTKLSGDLLYQTNFDNLDDFWHEGSPDVSVNAGSLILRTLFERDDAKHFVSSVFLKRIFRGDLMVEFQARSIHADSHRNFNFFIHTRHPDGRDLYATRGERTGDYPEYHVLDNYLFTCLKSDQQDHEGFDFFRYRMRRDPGFCLMKEVHAYRCENFRWYTFQFLVRQGAVSVCIDRLPHECYTWHDPRPLTEGYLGFRSFMSHLEYKNFSVFQVR
jgi:hypothetical protein